MDCGGARGVNHHRYLLLTLFEHRFFLDVGERPYAQFAEHADLADFCSVAFPMRNSVRGDLRGVKGTTRLAVGLNIVYFRSRETGIDADCTGVEFATG